jgi:hypothetical protein
MPDHGTVGDLMQDLGLSGFHPSALARRQHDGETAPEKGRLEGVNRGHTVSIRWHFAVELNQKRYFGNHFMSNEVVSAPGLVYFMLTIDDMYRAFQLSG